MVGVAGPEAGELPGVARLGQRTPRFERGDQHPLVGAEHLGRLGHEVHAREENRLGLDRLRLHRQCQRVAQEIGHGLHVGRRVVVGEDHGPALALEPCDAFAECGGFVHFLFLLFNY